MNKTVVKHISSLLYDHDCVIITNFGAFVCNHTSAKLDDVTGILSPPGKSILFNSQLKENDGLLINHISQKENISLDNAQIELAKFVEDCKKNLSQFKSLRFDKIGLLTLNDENKIIFNQDSNINYNKNSFGFQNLVNNKITRDHAEVVEESLKIIKSKKTFNSKRILKAAAILIPLIGISLLSITQEKAVDKVYNQIAELNPLSIFKFFRDCKNCQYLDNVFNSSVLKKSSSCFFLIKSSLFLISNWVVCLSILKSKTPFSEKNSEVIIALTRVFPLLG